LITVANLIDYPKQIDKSGCNTKQQEYDFKSGLGPHPPVHPIPDAVANPDASGKHDSYG
jgi:hypothetical protein